MTDDLVNRLQTLSHPASESLPDGKRLTLLILIAREAADAIDRKDAALRVALGALEGLNVAVDNFWNDSARPALVVKSADKISDNQLLAEVAIAKIKEALND